MVLKTDHHANVKPFMINERLKAIKKALNPLTEFSLHKVLCQ